MRVHAILIFLAIVSAPSLGGTPAGSATPEVHLSFDSLDAGTHFNYSITHTELVRSAWIEVLDRPLVIARKDVTVEPYGELTWDWNQGLINFFEQPDESLVLSIWDPNGETITCDISTVMTANPGGVVSSATVGGRAKLVPYPRLGSSFVRVVPGSSVVTLDVLGADLSQLTKFQVQPTKGARCGNESVHAQVLNLAHAHVTLAAECLQKPGILSVSTDASQEKSAVFHVASRQSPVLRSVLPAMLPEDMSQNKLTLVLHGRGFTESSTVYSGYFPDHPGNYMGDQMELETTYISPTELRVTAHADSDELTVSDKVPRGEKLRIWVRGDAEKYELSEFRDVVLRPATRNPKLERVRASDFRRGQTKIPIVTSVWPFPIKLMNERSPEELKVTIQGENFVPEDKVRFAFGNQADNDREVRTEYVSPTMLRAWLPRQLFRKHQISYRLVVETTTGQRYTRQIDVKADEE